MVLSFWCLNDADHYLDFMTIESHVAMLLQHSHYVNWWVRKLNIHYVWSFRSNKKSVSSQIDSIRWFKKRLAHFIHLTRAPICFNSFSRLGHHHAYTDSHLPTVVTTISTNLNLVHYLNIWYLTICHQCLDHPPTLLSHYHHIQLHFRLHQPHYIIYQQSLFTFFKPTLR